MKKIKPYKDVKVGDIAFESPDVGGSWDNEEGEVLWVGTTEELRASRYAKCLTQWEDEDATPDEYDLIVVKTEVISGIFREVLFNYNNDPSGVVVFED